MNGFPSTTPPVVPPAYLAPIDPRLAGSAAVSANVVYWMRLPRVQAPILLSKASYFWLSTSANAAMALLTADRPVITEADATAATYTAVATAAPVAASGANTWQPLTFASPYLLAPSVDLWVAIGFDAAATIARFSSAGSISLPFGMAVAKAAAYSSGVPSPISGSLISTAIYPAVIVSP